MMFFINNKNPNMEIKWVLGISVIFGILYGIFINPLWADAVEFGQAWAGLVPYQYSPWGQALFLTPSLQITIPALLLLAGVNVWPLCLAVTSFFCALSFSAIAATTYALSRNVLLSIVIPFLLITYVFANSHGYPIAYPVSYFQFGQTGQYFALLGLALLSCQLPIAAGAIGGILGGIHPVWCLCFALAAFPVTAWLQPKLLIRLSLSFVVMLILSVALQYFGNALLPPKPEYTPPPVPKIVLSANTTTNKVTKIEASKEIKKPTRGTFEGHNVLFSDSSSPIKTATIFFFPEVIFLMLCFSFFLVQGKSTPKLLIMLAIPMGLTTIFKIMEEIDPHFYMLGMLNEHLPGLAIRAIIDRWLNLNSLLIPLMTFSLLTVLIRDKKSWLATILLTGLLIFEAKNPTWFLVPISGAMNYLWGFLAFFLLGMFCYWRVIKSSAGIAVQNSLQKYFENFQFLIVLITLALVLIVKIKEFTVIAHSNPVFTGFDQADKLVSVAKKDKGVLLISPGVVYAQGFNPQLRTGRPIIVPTKLDVYNNLSKKIISVFCYSDPLLPFDKFYANVKPCFENRSLAEWAIISKQTHATGIIAPVGWEFKMKPVITGGGFAYYNIARLN